MESKPIAVCITDTHLDEENFYIVFDKFKEAVVIAKNLGLKHIFHLGDIFTSRSSQKLITLLSFKKILDYLKKQGIILHVIPGNHDKTDQSIEESYLDIYSYHNNILIYRGFLKECKSDYVEIDLVRFYFLGYFSEEEYDERLELIKQSLDSRYKNILLTHIGIDGVLNNNGNKIDNVLGIGKFRGFDKVFIGHYHNYTKVTSKIFYMGSTDPRNFGEDSDKGCIIINDDLSFEKYQFTFKEYKKIEISDFEDYKIKELLNQYSHNDDNIRFEFVGTEEDFLKIDKKFIQSLGIDVTTINIENVILNEEDQEEQYSVIGMSKQDLLKNFVSYCKEQKIGNKRSSKILKMF